MRKTMARQSNTRCFSWVPLNMFNIVRPRAKQRVHRGVTSSSNTRTSDAFFITPFDHCIVEPAGALICASDPQPFKAFQYKELFINYAMKSSIVSFELWAAKTKKSMILVKEIFFLIFLIFKMHACNGTTK